MPWINTTMFCHGAVWRYASPVLHGGLFFCVLVFLIRPSRALSDFDGDYAPEIGTEDPLRTSCRRTSSWDPIALKIGLKVAGESPASFEPMYVRFFKREVSRRHDVRRGIILGQNFESGFRRRISKKDNHDCIVLCSMIKKYFFFENKVQMYYNKRYKMILMPLF